MLTDRQQFTKRLFDIIVSVILLVIVIIPLILLLIFVRFYFNRNPIFIQQRIGKDGVPFKMYKIRSLHNDFYSSLVETSKALTPFGSWLRKSKIDELPQLFNVLQGTMSLVGPRPDVEGYADLLEGEDRIILSVPPAITGPASIKYKNEEALLLKQNNPQKYNDTVIWKDKVEINKEYIKNWNLLKDIRYLLSSLFDI